MFTEEEWSNITSYLVAKVREYCLIHSMDKEDFAKKLGVSSRVLTRFYSKKVNPNEQRNNKLLTSLEFFVKFSKALEIDVVRFFSEIYLSANNKSITSTNKEELIFDRKLSKIMDNKIINLHKKYSLKKVSLDSFLTIGIILSLISNSSLKIILKIIESDGFDNMDDNERELILSKIKLIGSNC